MLKNWIKSLFLLLSVCCFSVSESTAQTDQEHIEIALRMVGHQLLLSSNDSTSRVLPIEKNGDAYRISFESEFWFNPDRLAQLVDSIMEVERIAKGYRVEVLDKETLANVYGYQVDSTSSLIPCASRSQPKGAYDIFFRILEEWPIESDQIAATLKKEDVEREKSANTMTLILLLALVLIIVGLAVYFRKKKTVEKSVDPTKVHIGEYCFDERNMKLIHKNATVDLTSKETDLLKLLHSSANTTLQREEILNVVWGDEGDYVGRTLDVFISKLRKKFSEDTNVKIVNVRGVGYKMLLADPE